MADRTVHLSDLVGASEIADRLGLNKSSVVHDWRTRDLGFPAPVLTLRMGHLWLWPDVEKWARSTGRLSS